MVKVIFSDFDNTLMDYYSDKNYFDDYQIEVLRKVKEKGIKFCVVTGRCMTFFNQFPKLLEVVDYKEEAKKIESEVVKTKSNDVFSTGIIIVFSFILGFFISESCKYLVGKPTIFF